ncbi:hypothetical protein MCOR27_005688 [Pyricularia oryzae]|nr:hypothetical protein MCOR26_009413 [Pyricularia oryzae]KAI6278274.1 hypothetical protein MCOR27_005688 [Pyricularia oryzae]KAI6542942.1 hypothetical protein MCOR05_003495 [Pyricularia oryzae]
MNLFKSIAVGVAHNEKPRLISTSTLWWKPLGQAAEIIQAPMFVYDTVHSRAGEETMSYIRKRALLACDFCRHRKRRCDGERPCSTCRESAAECRYKELPVERVDLPTGSAPASDPVAERLGRIELLLQEHSERLNELAQGGGTTASSPFQPNLFSLPASYSYQLQRQQQEQLEQSPQLGGLQSRHDPGSVNLDPRLDHHQFLIPTDHFTSASSLFALPRIRNMLGEYPRSLFHDIEDSLPLPEPLDLFQSKKLDWPSLDNSAFESLSANYFARVHSTYPLFTEHDFIQWRTDIYDHGPAETPETAICLCVWALGAIAPADEEVPLPLHIQAEKDQLAMSLFQPALRLLLKWTVWGFQPSLPICQALVLAASFFAHLGRPLHSWRMAYFASHNFIFLYEKQRKANGHLQAPNDDYLRVLWSCFMIECDRAAELELPRTGIEPMADRLSDQMPLPRSLNPLEHEELIYFAAETAARRLLNRVHSSLYSSEHSGLISFSDMNPATGSLSLVKLVNVSSELHRQLEEWYLSIPESLRPPLGTEPCPNDRARVLRLRFYAARHIIHRPFVLYAALMQQQARSLAPSSVGSSPVSPHMSASTPASSSAVPAGSVQPLTSIPQIVLDKSEICIKTCSTYLRNSTEMLDKRSPYLWTFSQTSMANLLVLVTCDSIPQLQRFTTDVKELKELLVSKLRLWATPGSSFEAEMRILERITTRD